MKITCNLSTLLAGMALAGLSGCASIRAGLDEASDPESKEQYMAVDRHSSYPAVRRLYFEQVNLLELIDPTNRSAYSRPAAGSTEDQRRMSFGVQYDQVLSWFRTNEDPPELKRQHRNSVQDKILAVSTSRCNVFKTYLRRQQSDVNFGLGVATTISGVLGAILPGAQASRNLAGMAGMFSGVQAEYNQAYYSNLASHVIVQGIELRQNRMRKDLVEGRKGMSVTDYSMEAAINDALLVDGSCSTLAGLIEAQDSIKEVENPGLGMAARAMTSAKALHELNEKSVSELSRDGSLERLMAVADRKIPSLMVASAGGDGGAVTLTAELSAARQLATDLDRYVDLRADGLAAIFKARQDKAGEGKKGPLAPATLSEEFAKAVKAKLGAWRDPAKEPALSCTQRVNATAAELGSKTALQSLGLGDKDVEAALAVEQARAKAKAVVVQVDAIRTMARTQVDLAQNTVMTTLPAVAKIETFDKAAMTAALGKIVVTLPPDVKCQP